MASESPGAVVELQLAGPLTPRVSDLVDGGGVCDSAIVARAQMMLLLPGQGPFFRTAGLYVPSAGAQGQVR